MNLATSTFIIFLLLSPAILARRIYFTKELSKEFTVRNTLQEIFSSIFLALGLHALWCLLASIPIFSDGVDFGFILRILTDSKGLTVYTSFTEHIGQIFIYFFSLYAVAGYGGYKFNRIVLNNRWDRKYEPLEFDNKWYYLISGKVLELARYRQHLGADYKFENIKFRYADILVKSDDNIIYSGTIVDYQLNANNSIDFIVLAKPEKIFVTKIKDALGNVTSLKEDPQNFPTAYLVIPYSDILNINLRFYETDEKTTKNTDNSVNDTSTVRTNNGSSKVEDIKKNNSRPIKPKPPQQKKGKRNRKRKKH